MNGSWGSSKKFFVITDRFSFIINQELQLAASVVSGGTGGRAATPADLALPYSAPCRPRLLAIRDALHPPPRPPRLPLRAADDAMRGHGGGEQEQRVRGRCAASGPAAEAPAGADDEPSSVQDAGHRMGARDCDALP